MLRTLCIAVLAVGLVPNTLVGQLRSADVGIVRPPAAQHDRRAWPPPDSAHIRPTYWLETATVVGLGLGAAFGALGLSICEYSEISERSCWQYGLSGALLGGFTGFTIGALIGGQIPKRPAPDR